MKVGDKVVIVSRDYEGEEETHYFDVGQICTIVKIEEDEYRLKGWFKEGRKMIYQTVYEEQITPYEVKTN